MTKQHKGKEKQIIALFGYAMDNSVRANKFTSFEAVKKYKVKWKKISYFICAFEVKGEIVYEKP